MSSSIRFQPMKSKTTMESEKYFEKIETYLAGQMPKAEAEAFRKEAEDNSDLQEMLLQHRLANQSIEMAQDQFLIEKMQAIRKQYGPLTRPETPVIGLRKWMARAAAILALIVGGAGVYANLNHSDGAIVRAYYAPAASPTIAGADLEAEALFSQALSQYYQNKDYAGALQSFMAIGADDKKYREAQYFIPHCQLQTGNPTQALAGFDQLLQDNNIPVFAKREDVEWNRLLCYIDLKEEEKVRQVLRDMLEGEQYSSELKEKARRLNTQLNSFWRQLAF